MLALGAGEKAKGSPAVRARPTLANPGEVFSALLADKLAGHLAGDAARGPQQLSCARGEKGRAVEEAAERALCPKRHATPIARADGDRIGWVQW